jgi:hypothetical protein
MAAAAEATPEEAATATKLPPHRTTAARICYASFAIFFYLSKNKMHVVSLKKMHRT